MRSIFRRCASRTPTFSRSRTTSRTRTSIWRLLLDRRIIGALSPRKLERGHVAATPYRLGERACQTPSMYQAVRMRRLITVNDRMQQDYRYELVEPVGRNFDPEFKPDLTPAEMLCLGVFGGKYMTDCGDEFPASWFKYARLASGSRDRLTQLLRCRCQSAALGMAPERMDTFGRSTWLVPMVLPLLYGATNARRGRSADQTLESNPPSRPTASACVRAW